MYGRVISVELSFHNRLLAACKSTTASKDLQQDMYLEGIALRLEPCVTWYSTKTLEDGSSALSQAKGFSSERNNLYKIIWNKEWENLFHFVFSVFFSLNDKKNNSQNFLLFWKSRFSCKDESLNMKILCFFFIFFFIKNQTLM